MKQIPYGVPSFERIMTENFYYIDKTHYIEKLEADGAPYLSLFRPRRFGKSLFISMLENYYDINKAEQFESLFKGTYIYDHPTTLKNTYYILHFDFSKIEASKPLDEIELNFTKIVHKSIGDFFDSYKDITGGYDQFLKEIEFSSSASSIFNNFISYLRRINIKIYLLIDEYDNFANNILMQHGENAYINTTQKGGFFRAFFTCIKAATYKDTVHRIFITGVTPMVLSDITSGMNILANLSFEKDFASALGFTEKECSDCLSYYVKEGLIKEEDQNTLLDTTRKYCNNYIFSPNDSTERVFNSDMFLFILRGYLKSQSIPDELADPNIITDYAKLRSLVFYDKKLTDKFSVLSDLITNKTVSAELTMQFSLEAITDIPAFISLLYYLGLITIEKRFYGKKYFFKIPNQTIREIHFKYIYQLLQEKFNLQSNYFDSAIEDMGINGNWENALITITNKFFEIASLRDYIKQELALKMCLMTIFSINNFFAVYSERELNKGYADIYLEPSIQTKDLANYAYLIELKYLKSEENTPQELAIIEKEATEQLTQYSTGNLNTDKTVKKIVLVMSSKKIEILKEV